MSFFLSNQGYIQLQISAAPLAVKDTESFVATAGHLAEGVVWTKGIEGAVCAGLYRNRLVKESRLLLR
jgi:hypothetical protein